jgi:hypothetical protein
VSYFGSRATNSGLILGQPITILPALHFTMGGRGGGLDSIGFLGSQSMVDIIMSLKIKRYEQYKKYLEVLKNLNVADQWFLNHEIEDKSWEKAEKKLQELINEASKLYLLVF